MKQLLCLLLVISLVACDDILWTDGPTRIKGHVIDRLTNQKVANVKVYLTICRIRFINGSEVCNEVLDSTVTNADGYYQLRFKDRRKTNFGVVVGEYPINNLVYDPSGNQNVTDSKDFRVKEGSVNEFDFYVLPLKVLAVQVKLVKNEYNNIVVDYRTGNGRVWIDTVPIKLDRVASRIDTTLYFKVIPLTDALVYVSSKSPDQPVVELKQVVSVTASDTTKIEFND